MKPPISTFRLVLAALFLTGFGARGQDGFTEAVQTHVDHIEEFIERFNFEHDTRFHRFVNSSYPDLQADRAMVVESLFNRRIRRNDTLRRKQFVDDVTSPYRPVLLEIYDALWYATVPVRVIFDKSTMDVEVTLEIQLNDDFSIEWTIVGMNSVDFEGTQSPRPLYISASSHATFFPELKPGLSSVDLFKSVVSDSHKLSNIEKYKDLIEQQKVKDVKILSGIQYHFLQIPGWIMVVDYAPQDYSLNTGWLISEVIPVDTFLHKRRYQKEILNISPSE